MSQRSEANIVFSRPGRNGVAEGTVWTDLIGLQHLPSQRVRSIAGHMSKQGFPLIGVTRGRDHRVLHGGQRDRAAEMVGGVLLVSLRERGSDRQREGRLHLRDWLNLLLALGWVKEAIHHELKSALLREHGSQESDLLGEVG